MHLRTTNLQDPEGKWEYAVVLFLKTLVTAPTLPFQLWISGYFFLSWFVSYLYGGSCEDDFYGEVLQTIKVLDIFSFKVFSVHTWCLSFFTQPQFEAKKFYFFFFYGLVSCIDEGSCEDDVKRGRFCKQLEFLMFFFFSCNKLLAKKFPCLWFV